MKIARTLAIAIVAGVVLFVLAVMAGGMAVYTKQSGFCASCKIMQTRYVAWERSTHARSIHAQADCIECHSEPGVVGEFRAHLNGARYVLERITGGHRGPLLGAKVYTKACEECHKPTEIVVKNPGHAINHVAHLTHNLECFQCHINLAHGTLLGEPSAHPMETCASCHRRQQFQMSRCTVCHPKVMIDNLFLRPKVIRTTM